tara:strand:- start:222 stop:407 length:186 start_codon:yes stop_codon:yes gene_type:complete
MGRPKVLDDDKAHLSLYISRDDKKFIDSFAKASYRDITGVVRFAINILRTQYNEKGAKHGI